MIVALLVAPVLSVLAWFAAGALTGERSASPLAGHSYPLVVHSNCRYASGICTVSNEDLKLNITTANDAPHFLVLEASHGLDSVVIAPISSELGDAPRPMSVQGDDGRRWQVHAGLFASGSGKIRLAVTRRGSAFYVETGTEFLRQATH